MGLLTKFTSKPPLPKPGFPKVCGTLVQACLAVPLCLAPARSTCHSFQSLLPSSFCQNLAFLTFVERTICLAVLLHLAPACRAAALVTHCKIYCLGPLAKSGFSSECETHVLPRNAAPFSTGLQRCVTLCCCRTCPRPWQPPSTGVCVRACANTRAHHGRTQARTQTLVRTGRHACLGTISLFLSLSLKCSNT